MVGVDRLWRSKVGTGDACEGDRDSSEALVAVLAMLAAQPGVRLARMSGSGATCFALFDDRAQRDAADRTIAAAHPDWWRLASRLA